MEVKKSGENDDDVKKAYDVFICYSRKDRDVVKPIWEELEANGFSCGIDLEELSSGSRFTEQIVKAIKCSSVYLFILSDNSQKSQWALQELRFARRSNKRVVLVRPNGDAMTDEFAFDFQDADIIDWRQPEQKAKLLHDLRLWAANSDFRCES